MPDAAAGTVIPSLLIDSVSLTAHNIACAGGLCEVVYNAILLLF